MDSMPVYNILSEVKLLLYTEVQSNFCLYMFYFCESFQEPGYPYTLQFCIF